jgi:hypothetical protein
MTRKYSKKTGEMFRDTQQVNNTIDKFSNLQDKRNEVTKNSGLLWYVFGYKLESKPWLTYEETYCEN